MSERPLSDPSGADDGATERLVGLRLATRIHGLLRVARLYHETNQTYQQQLEEVLAALQNTLEDETTLLMMGDTFYLNGVRLRAPSSQMPLFRALQEEFESRGLGALRFLPGLRADELATLVRILVAVRTPEEGDRLPEMVAEAGVLRVVPVRARDLGHDGADDDGESAGPRDERGRAREIFRRAVHGTRSLLMRTARTGRLPLRQARHLVQPVVDSIMKNEFSLVGMTAIKEHDEYTYVHCVNVSVLSVAMGQMLDLPRPVLANLGVAALLHDLGKLAIPAEVLHKPGKLTPEEWRSMERHPLEGVKLVTRLPGLTQLTLDVMRVTLEHHRHVDGGGYPRGGADHTMAALSRLVAVADCFDAMTGHRAYRARPFTGREALEHLAGPESRRHDPTALWALIRAVGLFPPGTVLLTVSGYRLLSLSPGTDPYRPRCRVLQRPDGTVPPEHTPELWEPMPSEERVARIFSPEEYSVPVEALLAA